MTRAQQIAELEAAALQAHVDFVPWSEFWPSIAGAVAELEPFNLARWRKLHQHLARLHLVGPTARREEIPEVTGELVQQTFFPVFDQTISPPGAAPTADT